jgi:RNA recognition motif-containing protein
MNIFVRNLNARTTAQHLWQLFLQFGQVFSVRLVMHNKAGAAGGAAYVQMDNQAALIAIRELDGVNFMNHFLEIMPEER